MKILIINGSPHSNGDTNYILKKIKEKYPKETEFEQLILYKENIKPCMDCRYCWKNRGCAIHDKMDIIWKDDYDIVILASPIYMFNVTPPVFSLITRLNMLWCNNFFQKRNLKLREKRGILVLVGGGNDAPTHAIDMAKLTFNFLNAKFDLKNDYIYSLNTNDIAAKEDENVTKLINRVIGIN